VVLENEWLSVTVLPEKGADIYRLVYKPKDVDVLWKAPWGLKPPASGVPSAATSEEAWLEHYEGGWQEIFPNGGDACVYKGCHLNFHGEASTLPWEPVIQETRTAATARFAVTLYRSPFRLERSMTVEAGKPVLHITEKLTSRAEEPVHFMWGHHPAFGAPFLDGDCVIRLPGATFEAHSVEIAPTSRIAAGTVAPWPRIPGKQGIVDLSIVPPPSERHCEFGYLRDLAAGWYAIASRKHDFSFGLSWPLETFPYLWFWQELRGSFGYPWYGGCYVMAIEPFSSIPGTGLENAIRSGTAPVLEPGQSIGIELAAVFVPGQDRIAKISTGGEVTLGE
jgi:galactose mutarotase-like enzyme